MRRAVRPSGRDLETLDDVFLSLTGHASATDETETAA